MPHNHLQILEGYCNRRGGLCCFSAVGDRIIDHHLLIGITICHCIVAWPRCEFDLLDSIHKNNLDRAVNAFRQTYISDCEIISDINICVIRQNI